MTEAEIKELEADLRLHKEDRLRLRLENMRLETEIKKLKAVIAMTERERDDAIAGQYLKREFLRGAWIMRESIGERIGRIRARISPSTIAKIQVAIQDMSLPERP